MPPIIQCVPNFSEGRHPEVLCELQEAGRSPGVILADFSADPDHNRCVATLLGDPQGLESAVVKMASVAVRRIDLRVHSGRHPRVGALDVLPFIPFRNASLDDCVTLAHKVGSRIGSELDVPVYLYGAAATHPDHIPLPALRQGGLEGLRERMPSDVPDFGPRQPHPTAGVTIAGARLPLLAFNVNLDTDNLTAARRIARRLRASNGGLPGVRALGLQMESAGYAQVSVNITDTDAVTLFTVCDAVRRMGQEEGVTVRDCELIGGISLPQTVAALNEALDARIHVRQVLDAWLPPIMIEDGKDL